LPEIDVLCDLMIKKRWIEYIVITKKAKSIIDEISITGRTASDGENGDLRKRGGGTRRRL